MHDAYATSQTYHSLRRVQMVNALFGVKNFGRIVGITNSFTGLVGLLVLPLSDVAIGAMRSKFWKLNLAQVWPPQDFACQG